MEQNQTIQNQTDDDCDADSQEPNNDQDGGREEIRTNPRSLNTTRLRASVSEFLYCFTVIMSNRNIYQVQRSPRSLFHVGESRRVRTRSRESGPGAVSPGTIDNYSTQAAIWKILAFSQRGTH